MTVSWTRRKPSGTLTLSPKIWGELDDRGDNRSAALERHLERYVAALASRGDFLVDYFTSPEWAVLIVSVPEVSADALLSMQGWKLVEQQVIRNDLAKRYKIDLRTLMNKLAALPLLDVLALIDGVERWCLYAKRVEKPSQVNPFKLKELTA